MAQWGNRDQYSDAPKFIVDSATGKSGQQEFGNTVYLADVAETSATKGIASAGWVRRTVGTGGRAGRVFFETLVAVGSVTTDATDFANTSNSNVANTTGTADDAVLPDA